MPSSESLALGLLANFSGQGPKPLNARAFVRVDRDSFDEAIRALQPTALLELPFCHSLRISCWRDFHPEQLAERVPALKALLHARSEVADRSAMEHHLREARVSPDVAAERATSPPSTESTNRSTALPPEDAGELLDSILGGSDPAQPQRAAHESDFDRMVRAIGREAGSEQDFAREDARRAAIDKELERRVRAILHHPAFQRLEANWTTLRRIVREVEDSEIRLLDLRLDEVVADAQQPPDQRALEARFESAVDGEPLRFAALFCGFEIDADAGGLVACEALSSIASKCGAALIADIHQEDVANRTLPSAQWRSELAERTKDNLTLVTPRVLLRVPYGEETDEVDDFAFEEFEGFEDDAAAFPYLWGSGALAVAIAVARDRERGKLTGEIPRLPLHVYRRDGQTHSIGPTEVALGEKRIDELNAAGFTCVVQFVGGDTPLVVGLRSASGRRLIES